MDSEGGQDFGPDNDLSRNDPTPEDHLDAFLAQQTVSISPDDIERISVEYNLEEYQQQRLILLLSVGDCSILFMS